MSIDAIDDTGAEMPMWKRVTFAIFEKMITSGSLTQNVVISECAIVKTE